MLTLRRNLLLALGLLALLFGAALSEFWLRQQTVTSRPGGSLPARVSVLAAAHAIATGALLRPKDMTLIGIAPADMKPGFIAHDAAVQRDYVGALVRRDFAAGEPLSADGLLKPSDRSFLSAVLAPGMRAVTLPVEAPQTASGLVLPGDHVDVVLTQNLGPDADAGRRAVAETVLSDVRVVAVEQSLTPSPRPLGADSRFVQDLRPPRTMTLETSESEAQKLLVAAQLGKIDLALRALVANAQPNDAPVAPTWAGDVSSAIKAVGARAQKPAAAPQPAPAAPAAPAVPVHSTIEVMHGGKIDLR